MRKEGKEEAKIKTEGLSEASTVPVRDADPLVSFGSFLGNEFMDPSSPRDAAPLCKTRRKFVWQAG